MKFEWKVWYQPITCITFLIYVINCLLILYITLLVNYGSFYNMTFVLWAPDILEIFKTYFKS